MVYLYAIGFTIVYWVIFWVAALWDINTDRPYNLTTDEILVPLLAIYIVALGSIIYFT